MTERRFTLRQPGSTVLILEQCAMLPLPVPLGDHHKHAPSYHSRRDADRQTALYHCGFTVLAVRVMEPGSSTRDSKVSNTSFRLLDVCGLVKETSQ